VEEKLPRLNPVWAYLKYEKSAWANTKSAWANTLSSFENADARQSIGLKGDGRLSRGLSILVIGALSLAAWAAVICLALAVAALL